MSLQLGDLDARQIRLQIPNRGAWLADVDLDLTSDQPLPSGKQTLVIGTTTLVGTVIPQGTGRLGDTARVRLLAGAAGWATLLKPFHWHNDAPSGVSSATVVQATANAVGETANDPNPVSYGKDFERVGDPRFNGLAPASSVLEGRDWHVDAQGITQIGPWPSIAKGADADVLLYEQEERVATLSADEPVWPGTRLEADARFADVVVCEVEQIFAASGARVTAWCGAKLEDRFGNVMTTLAGLNDPAFERIYWYRISSQGDDGRLRLQAMTKDGGAPDTLPISVWPGVPGATAKHKLGTLCAVYFLNGDRTQPRVFSFDGVSPLELHLDAVDFIELGANATERATVAGPVQDALDAVKKFAQALSLLTTAPLTPVGSAGDDLYTALGALLPTPVTYKPVKTDFVRIKP